MSETAAVAFNPFEPGYAENPYDQYAALRERDPVHQSVLGFWMLFRHADVTTLLRDRLSVEERNARPGPFTAQVEAMVAEVGFDNRERRSMLGLDPPDHTRLRRLVSAAFTPRTIEQLRPRVQQMVDDHLDRAAAEGGFDVIPGLAFPLPFEVISEMLGMPDVNRDEVRSWSSTMVRSLDPVFDPDLMRAIIQAGHQMEAFVAEAIAWKRRTPADDLLTALIAAEDEGDRLTEEELLDQVVLLYIAGHETTVNLIGNGTLALLRHPDQLALLRGDPSLDAKAVEELLRYDPPVQITRRITLEDCEVAGRSFEAGTMVTAVLGSANRDLEVFGDDADRVRLDRPQASKQVAFGGGVHHCLGAALARLEGQVAIGTLVRRFPHLALAGEPVWNGRINLRGLESLPVTVG